MNDFKKEQISAFMDGELDGNPERIVDQLLGDRELMDAWDRYHLVSGCLNRQLPEYLDKDLAGKISASLRDEPAIVAPGKFSSSLVKPVVGFALAASVAALAILGVQQQGLEETPPPLADNVAKTTTDIAADKSIYAPPSPAGSRGPAFQPGQPQRNTRLNRYIVHYNKHRTGVSRQDILPVIAIFVEKTDTEANMNAGHSNLGGINAFARYTRGHQVTAVGEVSQATVQRMANSVVSLMESRGRTVEEGRR